MAYIYFGLDIGKQHDYTAYCLLQRVDPNGETDIDQIAARQQRNRQGLPPLAPDAPIEYHIRALERIELKTPYPKQVDEIRDRLRSLKGHGVYFLVDRGGVGDAVYDMFTGLGINAMLTGIRLHGGIKDLPDTEGGYSVSKRNLIASAQVLLEKDLLRVNKNHPPKLWPLCKKELGAYKVTISENGQDTYANDPRQQPNDDLVIALSMGTWYATYLEKQGRSWNIL